MSKKHFAILAIFLSCFIFLSACSASSNKTAAPQSPAMGEMAAGSAANADMSTTSSISKDKQASSPRPIGEKKLILTAELAMETTSFDDAVKALNALVNKYSGYFEYSNVYGGGYHAYSAARSGEYTIRIPAKDYSAFMKESGSVALITRSSENATDVSEQYFDLETRLKTLRTKQDRLLSLLEKASVMEDIIALENSLSDVTYEIESYTSTLQKLSAQVEYSSVHISLNEVYKLTDLEQTPENFGSRVLKALKGGFKDFLNSAEDIFVACVYALPVLLIFAFLLILILFIVRRKRHKKSSKRTVEKLEEKKENSEE